MRLRLIVVICLSVVAVPSLASADRHAFIGVHPRDDGGICYIEAPHYHVYKPQKRKLLYRDYDGRAMFVGDPVAYGYEGERHAYYGHHPIQVDVVLGADDPQTEYCYLDGPHFHAFAPPAHAKFELKGDAYWYVGALPRAYEEPRARLVAVNTVYEPIEYVRPVVVVEPPSAWVGVSIHMGGHWHTGGHAHGTWKHKHGTWKHQHGTWKHQHGTWKHKRGTWKHQRGTWKHQRGTWKHKRGTWKHKRGTYKYKSHNRSYRRTRHSSVRRHRSYARSGKRKRAGGKRFRWSGKRRRR